MTAPKFQLGDRVFISDGNLEATVAEVRKTFMGVTYYLEYWRDSEPKSVVCREDELLPAPLKGEPCIGMKPCPARMEGR